ncbi:nitrite/sulfite reductase [Thalassorhabdomicrobium marinisediminis]|uniref:Sulfite reductase n=1 Tax=Thalassorhabdomicrobium marinisediminis TaxID=2170577 RepID=A0A2T7G1A7_9RHOB|nr:nitrite/sulfite reductase [Thalassorhabdomicrobium marinisediminis]PVA08205.1 sulfite reductase [Thalassorhabdomicrobium marinisediminis]
MYKYTDFDEAFVRERVAQLRAQVERRIDGSLTEDEFKPLRLMNGLYLQLHAYMLRVAVPYGTLNSAQMDRLAHLAETYDKGYGHFTTRQNIQFNWPELRRVPDMLSDLADVGMHSIQTSGNTIRNVTADHFAGAAADEIADPRPVAELLRQWSTDHPEFQFLPRKFKIAITGSPNDRAVIKSHDIGLRIVEQDGVRGYEVIVGGGLGPTPMIGKVINDFLPEAHLLPYVEAIVSVWNQIGRRDNKFKARIKITVHEHGIDEIRRRVDARFAEILPGFSGVDQQILRSIEAQFAPPAFKTADTRGYEAARLANPAFRSWSDTNLTPHRAEGYAIVSISLKKHGATPGDATAEQMRVMADLARRFSHDELRISHEQNVILPHVHRDDLPQVYAALRDADLATANIGLASDIIACPGMDYCALATARSIPIAQEIATRVDALKIEHDLGHLKIKISGCINACGHHHVGHIGILGLDRAGVENYQITLGGDHTETAAVGERAGPGFSATEIVPAIERLMLGYLDLRETEKETFLQAYRRLGPAPFKAVLYPETARKEARNAA